MKENIKKSFQIQNFLKSKNLIWRGCKIVDGDGGKMV